jgi:hypothetical protein
MGQKYENTLDSSNDFLIVLSLPVWRGDKESRTNYKGMFIFQKNERWNTQLI